MANNLEHLLGIPYSRSIYDGAEPREIEDIGTQPITAASCRLIMQEFLASFNGVRLPPEHAMSAEFFFYVGEFVVPYDPTQPEESFYHKVRNRTTTGHILLGMPRTEQRNRIPRTPASLHMAIILNPYDKIVEEMFPDSIIDLRQKFLPGEPAILHSTNRNANPYSHITHIGEFNQVYRPIAVKSVSYH